MKPPNGAVMHRHSFGGKQTQTDIWLIGSIYHVPTRNWFALYFSSAFARFSDDLSCQTVKGKFTKYLEADTEYKGKPFNQSERHSISAVMADVEFAKALIEQTGLHPWLYHTARTYIKDVIMNTNYRVECSKILNIDNS